jgi:hypothetical protein
VLATLLTRTSSKDNSSFITAKDERLEASLLKLGQQDQARAKLMGDGSETASVISLLNL